MICCRVSPSQKADVVTLIQEFTHGEVSLAIGDGANDVAMIQVCDLTLIKREVYIGFRIWP